MKYIKRIEPFLEQLKILWKQNPDLRFGQLIYIITNNKDLFNIEDTEMLKLIQKDNTGKAINNINNEIIKKPIFRSVDIDKELNNIKQYVERLENRNDELKNQFREWNKDKEIQKMKNELDNLRRESIHVLSKKEKEDSDKFRKKHWQECHGNTEFIISGNGIGINVICRCKKCGAEEDISDVSTW